MTFKEMLDKLGYNHVTPQPSIYNAEIIVVDPVSDERTGFEITGVFSDDQGRLVLHMGNELKEV